MTKDAAIPVSIIHVETGTEYRLGYCEIDELDELVKVIRTHGIYCGINDLDYPEAGEIRTQFAWNADHFPNAMWFEILLDGPPQVYTEVQVQTWALTH